MTLEERVDLLEKRMSKVIAIVTTTGSATMEAPNPDPPIDRAVEEIMHLGPNEFTEEIIRAIIERATTE